MGEFRRMLRTALVGAALMPAAGCAGMGMGPLGDILGTTGGSDGDLVGEVRYVDQRAQQIELRTREDRVARVRYDRETRVVYREQEYPVDALEAGDLVSVRVRNERGEPYAAAIHVQESVQERRGRDADDYGYGDEVDGRLQRVEGRVSAVDERRGLFQVETRDDELTVSLPYRPDRGVEERFRRLRRGDVVRLEGRFLSPRRFELERFR